jgi:hypothetical protein
MQVAGHLVCLSKNRRHPHPGIPGPVVKGRCFTRNLSLIPAAPVHMSTKQSTMTKGTVSWDDTSNSN